jgi:uncharacterized membrane protein YjgN (DUF898 family)
MTGQEQGEQTAGAGARFLGDRRPYMRLLVRGAALLTVTLGIYRFWFATDVRRFLWSNTEIAGETLEYSGTAFELLIGFLIAVAILVPLYAGFFLAALDLGVIGRLSGVVAFVLLFLLGQYAIYRARRYRLTRTIYRGLRFHQEGSTWGYAFRAVGWWALTLITLGLAYPFQLASLERYKMRHTYYGDLPGHFAGSGFGLFLRGFPMWFLVVAPLVLAVVIFIGGVNWGALADAVSHGGDEAMARIEGNNPAIGALIVFAMLMALASVALAALLYPAFQSMTLRWWSSGLRFGTLKVTSQLRMRHIYGAYMRFLWWALLFSLVLAILAVPAFAVIGLLTGHDNGIAGEIAATVIVIGGYVIAVLGFSTIYRATVLLSLWQLSMEAVQLSGIDVLDRVKASGRPSSALGEGLADALHVGSY